MKIFCLRTSKLMKNKLGGILDIFCGYLNVLKSDGQEKSTKILISWQELKNKFLPFFFHRQLLGR